MRLLIVLVLAVVFIIVATAKFGLDPFLALLIAAGGYGLVCRTMSREDVVGSVNEGFGSTVGCLASVVLPGVVAGLSGLTVKQDCKLQTLGKLVEGGQPVLLCASLAQSFFDKLRAT